MTTGGDLAHARSLVGDLRRTVLSLGAEHGATVDVQRLRDDVARLAADLNLLAASKPAAAGTVDAEIVYISDEEYSPGFWADSDDEGLGAPGRR